MRLRGSSRLAGAGLVLTALLIAALLGSPSAASRAVGPVPYLALRDVHVRVEPGRSTLLAIGHGHGFRGVQVTRIRVVDGELFSDAPAWIDRSRMVAQVDASELPDGSWLVGMPGCAGEEDDLCQTPPTKVFRYDPDGDVDHLADVDAAGVSFVGFAADDLAVLATSNPRAPDAPYVGPTYLTLDASSGRLTEIAPAPDPVTAAAQPNDGRAYEPLQQREACAAGDLLWLMDAYIDPQGERRAQLTSVDIPSGVVSDPRPIDEPDHLRAALPFCGTDGSGWLVMSDELFRRPTVAPFDVHGELGALSEAVTPTDPGNPVAVLGLFRTESTALWQLGAIPSDDSSRLLWLSQGSWEHLDVHVPNSAQAARSGDGADMVIFNGSTIYPVGAHELPDRSSP